MIDDKQLIIIQFLLDLFFRCTSKGKVWIITVWIQQISIRTFPADVYRGYAAEVTVADFGCVTTRNHVSSLSHPGSCTPSCSCRMLHFIHRLQQLSVLRPDVIPVWYFFQSNPLKKTAVDKIPVCEDRIQICLSTTNEWKLLKGVKLASWHCPRRKELCRKIILISLCMENSRVSQPRKCLAVWTIRTWISEAICSMVQARTSTMQLWSSFHCSYFVCVFLSRCAQ